MEDFLDAHEPEGPHFLLDRLHECLLNEQPLLVDHLKGSHFKSSSPEEDPLLARYVEAVDFWENTRNMEDAIIGEAVEGCSYKFQVGRTGTESNLLLWTTFLLEEPFDELLGKFMEKELDHHFNPVMVKCDILKRSTSFVEHCQVFQIAGMLKMNYHMDQRNFLHPSEACGLVDSQSLQSTNSNRSIRQVAVVRAVSRNQSLVTYAGSFQVPKVPLFLSRLIVKKICPLIMKNCVNMLDCHTHEDFQKAMTTDEHGTFAMLKAQIDVWEKQGLIGVSDVPTSAQLLDWRQPSLPTQEVSDPQGSPTQQTSAGTCNRAASEQPVKRSRFYSRCSCKAYRKAEKAGRTVLHQMPFEAKLNKSSKKISRMAKDMPDPLNFRHFFRSSENYSTA